MTISEIILLVDLVLMLIYFLTSDWYMTDEELEERENRVTEYYR